MGEIAQELENFVKACSIPVENDEVRISMWF
jgi:hypothetical protein